VGGMIGGNPKEPILEGVTGSEREKSQIMEELIGIWGGRRNIMKGQVGVDLLSERVRDVLADERE
jgi:hypothetical protein